MALMKKGKQEAEGGQAATEQRRQGRTCGELLQALDSDDAAARRWAARDLASYPEAASGLCGRLPLENELAVREAILDSLLQIGNEQVVVCLLALLRSDDAALRNGVIEVMQSLPDAVAPHMQGLFDDPDSDVRIFAIDILQVLQHRDAPSWLLQVVEKDRHVNVVAAAVDRLAEVGTPDMVDALERVRERWSGQAFICFAIDAAIERIRGD